MFLMQSQEVSVATFALNSKLLNEPNFSVFFSFFCIFNNIFVWIWETESRCLCGPCVFSCIVL